MSPSRRCYFCGISTIHYGPRRRSRAPVRSYQLNDDFLLEHPSVMEYAGHMIEEPQITAEKKICRPCLQRADRFVIRQRRERMQEERNEAVQQAATDVGSGPNSVKRNKLMSSLRQYQTYSQTDVLVVKAFGVDDGQFNTSSCFSEILTIEDEEEEEEKRIPETNIPRLVPIEKLLQPHVIEPKPRTLLQNPETTDLNTQTIIDQQKPRADNNMFLAQNNTDSNKLLLYPVKGTDNTDDKFLILPNNSKIVVDGNELKLVNNSVPVLLPDGTMVTLAPQTQQIVVPIVNNIIPNSIAFNNNALTVKGIDTVEEIIIPDRGKIGEKVVSSVVFNNNNVAIETTNEKDNVSRAALSKTGELGRVNDLNQVGDLSRVGDTRRVGDVSQIVDDTNQTDDEICKITDLRSLQHDATEKCPPPKRANSNIDWEDKIPMDVISFMEKCNNTKHPPAKGNHWTPTLPTTPTHACILPDVTVSSGPCAISKTPAVPKIPTVSKAPTILNNLPPVARIPVISKCFVPPVTQRSVKAPKPNASVAEDDDMGLLKPMSRKPRVRKRKCDDDDVIIVS
ncbi:uncharacterized protein LOC128681995 isoform X2 [Plodia interpunctella]|uniref:uncharacterized protein LOC128681995 isoform X2 n=1 Tax=Plodia interpunctella TaxID=58824 RepID=UPI002368EC1C|nr:uncharacterized protein LOC128681995 isoform X2 [Plodia interpunctella]